MAKGIFINTPGARTSYYCCLCSLKLGRSKSTVDSHKRTGVLLLKPADSFSSSTHYLVTQVLLITQRTSLIPTSELQNPKPFQTIVTLPVESATPSASFRVCYKYGKSSPLSCVCKACGGCVGISCLDLCPNPSYLATGHTYSKCSYLKHFYQPLFWIRDTMSVRSPLFQYSFQGCSIVFVPFLGILVALF